MTISSYKQSLLRALGHAKLAMCSQWGREQLIQSCCTSNKKREATLVRLQVSFHVIAGYSYWWWRLLVIDLHVWPVNHSHGRSHLLLSLLHFPNGKGHCTSGSAPRRHVTATGTTITFWPAIKNTTISYGKVLDQSATNVKQMNFLKM